MSIEMPQAGDELILVVDNDGKREQWFATAEDLGRLLRDIHYGADVHLIEVRAITGVQSEPVPYGVDAAALFDTNDYAYPEVTVHMPDGTVRKTGYVIDGRA